MACRNLVLTLLLTAAIATACAPARPKLVGEQLSRDFAAGLMQVRTETSARISSVRGLAKVMVRSPEKSISGTQVLLAEKPDRLRAETLSPFGSPLLLLAADGEKLRVFLPSQNLFYSGAATSANLGRFVRLPLKLTDLVGVLLFQPPMIEAASEKAFELLDGGWLLVRSGASRRQELIFNDEQLVTEVSYYDRDTLLLRISYGQFSEGVERFPLLFGLEIPGQEITASLEFSEPEVNVRMQSGLFRLEPPPGVTIVSLDNE